MAPQTAPARHNLPRPTTGFVGRERDLSDLLRLLDADRAVTVCGADGIGKTRLALRVAAHSTGFFPDGVWFAELTDAFTPHEVFTRVAAAVGVAEEAGRGLDSTVIEALRGRRLLLVFDGCEHIVDHVTAVGRTLLDSCPAISLLLTSEVPVRLPGATVWRVPPMALPAPSLSAPPPDPAQAEAVRLFVERARARERSFAVGGPDLDTVAALCDQVGGSPLCIELLAAWAPELTLDGLRTALREHLDSPSARPEPGQALPRTRILPLVLDFVHERLSRAEQVLLRRLSVFRGWDLELAEQVCADALLPESEVLDVITGLLDRSLITLTGESEGAVRYRLPETVRLYACERLRAAGEEEVFMLRLRERMLHLVEDFGARLESGQAMPWAERGKDRLRVIAEYDTLRSVLRWSAERGDVEDGLRLCVGMVPHWVSYHHFTEGAQWLDRLLRSEDSRRAPSRGRALVGRAQLARVQRDHQTALELGEEGLALCRARGDGVSVRTALNLLALVDVRDRELERAAKRLEEVVSLAREAGDLWNEAIALSTRGALAALRGDFRGADTHYSGALMILRGIDHRWGVGITLIGQGSAAEAQGDFHSADRCYREALDIERILGASSEVARCLAGVGRVAHALGATEQAYDYLSEGLILSQSAGQHAEVARGLTSIARVAFGAGHVETACRLAGAAAAIREQIGLPVSPAPWPFDGASSDGARPRRGRRRGGPRDLRAWWEQGRHLDVADAVREAVHLAESGRVPRQRRHRARGDSPEKHLTPRELQIAHLVSTGKSNPEIARALFITPATAARHVANINRKMGFNSRKQIAAWVESHSVPR